MTDGPLIRDEDTGYPRLDADDQPIAELVLDSVDIGKEQGASIGELAAGQRSWRFGHVIVDEAQDLTPMQWRMVTRRARGGSMTIVGDLAQRSVGEPGAWRDHLPPAIADFAYRELTINYRSPAEINDLAARVLAELAPDLTPGKSIRSVGETPQFEEVASLNAELARVVQREVAVLDAGNLAVIGFDLPGSIPDVDDAILLDPWQAKGLEFDVVVLVEPARYLEEAHGLSHLFVALTRSTRRLVILHEQPLPPVLV